MRYSQNGVDTPMAIEINPQSIVMLRFQNLVAGFHQMKVCRKRNCTGLELSRREIIICIGVHVL